MELLVKPIEIVYKERNVNPIDVVLDFIINNYPIQDYPRVLEIAAGNGNLSSKLADLGYKVTAIDPKLKTKEESSYNILTEPFNESTNISDYDLGVAIHPCGIHKDIITNFRINEKALFLMPCYNITCDDRELIMYKNNDDWLNYLGTLNPKMKRKEFFSKMIIPDLLLESFSNAFYTK